MYFTLFVTVLITAAFLVVAAYAIAKLIGPRSYNPAKGEPYECGIPTYGTSWLPVHIGYSLRSGSLCWYWYLALRMLGGKEHWNGNKEAKNQVSSLRRVEGQ